MDVEEKNGRRGDAPRRSPRCRVGSDGGESLHFWATAGVSRRQRSDWGVGHRHPLAAGVRCCVMAMIGRLAGGSNGVARRPIPSRRPMSQSIHRTRASERSGANRPVQTRLFNSSPCRRLAAYPAEVQSHYRVVRALSNGQRRTSAGDLLAQGMSPKMLKGTLRGCGRAGMSPAPRRRVSGVISADASRNNTLPEGFVPAATTPEFRTLGPWTYGGEAS